MRASQKVAALGLFALGWGLVKSYMVSTELSHFTARTDPLGPIMLEAQAQDMLSPRHLLQSVVVGPALEELLYRRLLQPRIGRTAASVVFGLSHVGPTPNGTYQREIARALDAAAGGVLYGTAFALGGLPAAIGAHAAHNLGVCVGTSFGLRRGLGG